MQHYGIPTRLLDWTESLGVALYFSIGSTDWLKARPTIWLLDPFALAALSDKGEYIPIAADVNVNANADIAFCDDWETSKNSVSKLPLPVAPNFLFDRLAAQNGTFTIHGTDENPIDQLLANVKPEALLKFVAHGDHIPTIVNSIRMLRPSPDAIFPDMEGMKSHLI